MYSFKEMYETRQQEFLSHVSAVMLQRVKDVSTTGPISLEEYKTIRMNSYEQKYIAPHLSDEALVWKIKNAMDNVAMKVSDFRVPSTYEEYLLTDGIKELLKRFTK
jgi:hypothetical protein